MIEPLVAVITLPVLAPIVALLQLLFPSLMRNQYQQYKALIHTLLAQSSLMFAHWAAVQWLVKRRTWWLSDEALSLALLIIAVVGLAVSLRNRAVAQKAPHDLASGPPLRLEYIALSLFALTGIGWAFYQYRAGGSILDPMFPLTVACLVGLAHLALRKNRKPAAARARLVSTELAFLATAVFVGIGMAAYQRDTAPQKMAELVTAEWPTYRGDAQRSGGRDARAILKPKLLWTFAPQEKKGFLRMHSSPTVVDNQLYIGALHEVLTFTEGILYCIHVGEAKSSGSEALKPGELLWKFTADSTLKPVFSSPSVADGKLYFGEGYHQDSQCRLFCLDAAKGAQLWSIATKSHVESSPAVVGDAVYVGAGDDGLLCFTKEGLEPGENRLRWQLGRVHVDAAPMILCGKAIAGSVLGDIHKDFAVVAVDFQTGKEAWRTPAEMPIPGSPSQFSMNAIVGLGRGKMDHDDEHPAGAVWSLNIFTGNRDWEFPLPNAVLGSPVINDTFVYFGCRDGFCYCLDASTGKLKWKHDCGDAIVTSPAIGDGQTIVLTTAGILIAMDLKSGQEQWRFDELKTDDFDAYASPVVIGEKIYAAIGGKVHCVGEE
jgi:outer membrane protein assembly factor BamB